ncbi:PH domain-containing protein [Gilvimarinus algae]|uniref:PH domain-containing protein n=1 Tax=Gilvimarinus algae TaxID=3058037 RepID=A0ABT8TDK0_9GAMM|nr:PH domain-containing protein [Gilvimarinus sp. SDUM040014]MDO3382184.1 PH domain-containing protein [Gilvimarinus sp. SDUM040014]
MQIQDAVVEAAQLPPLLSEPWRPIDPSYQSVLRIVVCLVALLPLAACVAVVLFELEGLVLPAKLLAALILLLVVFLLLVWVPRRVAHTQYLLRELDVHKSTGYWWHATVSAGHNRIQHIEVTQGPLERVYGLSKLVLYTAGGGQSDIKIPGLPSETAKRLKNYLTDRITSEAATDDDGE